MWRLVGRSGEFGVQGSVRRTRAAPRPDRDDGAEALVGARFPASWPSDELLVSGFPYSRDAIRAEIDATGEDAPPAGVTAEVVGLPVLVADAIPYVDGPDVGAGTSKANTAILHTGFDAKPGTLENGLVRRGYRLLRDYASEAGIPVDPTGALLVAWDAEQEAALPKIRAGAEQNEVEVCITDGLIGDVGIAAARVLRLDDSPLQSVGPDSDMCRV